MQEAFPLDWPLGYARTKNRKYSRFQQTPGAALSFLRQEVSRLGGKNLVVSTSLPVRKDGGIYAEYLAKKVDDPGVAIYFDLNGEPIAMCCDQYDRVFDNAYALGKSVEALRGIDRWGCSEFMKRAFTGFKALPESGSATSENWAEEVLSVQPGDTWDRVKFLYRQRVKDSHPDTGGTAEMFDLVQRAFAHLKKKFNVAI